MEKLTYWQYLKNNGFWVFLGFTLFFAVVFCGYWLIHSGWEDSQSDIFTAIIIFSSVWSLYLLANFITWRKI